MRLVFGLSLAAWVATWDFDAMLIHVALRSWSTLAYVGVMTAGHMAEIIPLLFVANRQPFKG